MTTIAQISDIHVRPQGVLYQGVVDSNAMFARAVETLNRLAPAPDMVLITGDLVDQGAEDEYAMLQALLAGLRLPFAFLPGNHDRRDTLRAAFRDHPHIPSGEAFDFAMDVGAIRLIALDTSVPDAHHGELSTAQLGWLDRELAACRGRPALVAMHHPPFATGIPYLDRYGLHDAQAFADVIRAHDHVDRVIAGHVHRAMHARLGGTPVLTCPSTATQIALRLEPDAKPASYLEPPAFMLHRWAGDAPAVSHLVHIGDYGTAFPFA
ncbi:MAG TPA: phosphodiesterase [Bordetella sp.]